MDEHLRNLIEESIRKVLFEFNFSGTVTPKQEQTRLLSVNEAAERLGVSIGLIYKLVHADKLKAVRAFSSVRIAVEDLDDFIEQSKAGKN